MGQIVHTYFIFLTIFIIFSCVSEVEEKIIDKEDMVKILIEMHLVEKSIDNLKLDADTSRALFKIKEDQIFDKYSIDEELYRKSFSYYFFDPKELDVVYERVIDSLMLYQQIK